MREKSHNYKSFFGPYCPLYGLVTVIHWAKYSRKIGEVFGKPKKVLWYDPQKHHLKSFCSRFQSLSCKTLKGFTLSNGNLSIVKRLFANGKLHALHCVKSVRIQSYSGPHFPRILPHSDWMRENAGKMRTKTTPNKDSLRSVDVLFYMNVYFFVKSSVSHRWYCIFNILI